MFKRVVHWIVPNNNKQGTILDQKCHQINPFIVSFFLIARDLCTKSLIDSFEVTLSKTYASCIIKLNETILYAQLFSLHLHWLTGTTEYNEQDVAAALVPRQTDLIGVCFDDCLIVLVVDGGWKDFDW